MPDTLKCSSCGGINQLPDGINKMFCAFCGNIVESETEYFSEEITESSIKTKPQIVNKRLSLTNRKIKSLNEIIEWFSDEELRSIYFLDLSNNIISSLHGINNFSKLVGLNVSNNKLTSIISDDDSEYNFFLEKLDLSGNNISSLHGLDLFKSLKSIDLNSNSFENISDDDVNIINGIRLHSGVYERHRSYFRMELKNNKIKSNEWINKLKIEEIVFPQDNSFNQLELTFSVSIYTDDIVGKFSQDIEEKQYGWFSATTGERIDEISTRERLDAARSNFLSKKAAELADAKAIIQEKQNKKKKKNLRNNLIKLLILITFSWFIYYYIINKNTSDAENVIQPDISTQDTATSKENITTTKKKKSKKNNSLSKLILGTWKTECTAGVLVKKTMTFYEDGNVKMKTEDGELQEGKWQIVDDEIMFWVNEEYSTTKIKVDGDVFNGQITIKETGDNIEIKGERVK